MKTLKENIKIIVENILNEIYQEDPYFKSNDIYDYEPTDYEIANFTLIDKGYSKPIKTVKKKSTGKATLISMVNGKEEKIKYGNIALIKYLKKKYDFAYPQNKDKFIIKYEYV